MKKTGRKKQVLSVILAVILALPATLFNSMSARAESTIEIAEKGMPNGYEAIYTVEDLYGIRNNLGGKYILMNDIDLTEATSPGGDYDCGTGWEPIEGFEGILDGDGHRITGMHIFGNISHVKNIGLFGDIRGAVIQGLGIADCSIDITTKPTLIFVGSIAGRSDSANITNCYSSGSIKVQEIIEEDEGTSAYVGGLIGDASYNLEITNCYNSSSIECSTVEDEVFCGGICGSVGEGDGQQISQCYNVGKVTGGHAGAICGEAYYDYIFTNCKYLKGSAAQGVSGVSDKKSKCVSLTDGQMKSKKTFSGYDFMETWETDIFCSYAYPQLKNNRMVRVESIQLEAAPQKLIYDYGDNLELDGARLGVIYEDMKTTIPITLDMVGYYDMKKVGRQTVDINYGNAKASFDIEVREVPVTGIMIPKNISLYRMKSKKLMPQIMPENATDRSLVWKSDNPGIVSVDSNGLVKARSEGTTNIRVASKNGVEAVCTVKVLVPAISIKLSKTSVTLKEGERYSLTAQVAPIESTETVKWKSANTKVAEVKNGIVQAVGIGKTKITAYTEGGIKAYCTVTVKQSDSRAIKKVNATKATIKSAKNEKGRKIKLKLSGGSGCDGYKIQYGVKKNFKGAKTVTSKNSTVTIKKLKSQKTYYIHARVYKKISGKVYYGKWSILKSMRIKK